MLSSHFIYPPLNCAFANFFQRNFFKEEAQKLNKIIHRSIINMCIDCLVIVSIYEGRGRAI